MRLTRSLFQARRAVAQVAIDQLVASLARYTIALAQLGDAKALPQVVGDELRSLVHRRGLTPWHRAPPAGAPDRQPVTYVPRLNCYLCIWTVPQWHLTTPCSRPPQARFACLRFLCRFAPRRRLKANVRRQDREPRLQSRLRVDRGGFRSLAHRVCRYRVQRPALPALTAWEVSASPGHRAWPRRVPRRGG